MIAESEIARESRLIKRLRGRACGAFEELVHEHGPRMLAVIRRFLPQDHDSHDALQDAYVSAFKAVDRFHGQARLTTWLHRIAVNAALMRIRSQKRRQETPIDDLLPRYLTEGHRESVRANWAVASEKSNDDAETRELVRKSIERLPESYRAILVLRDIEERSTDETAEILNLTPANVKTRLHRARQALKELLEAHFAC
jgi:RNA polymerase sigma-70 factor, ECF subfamily